MSAGQEHAETHADMGDPIKSERWQRIAEAISDIRQMKNPVAVGSRS